MTRKVLDSGFLLLLLTSSFLLYGQQELVSSGGDFTGPGGSVAFSAGQVAYIGAASAGFILTEGVQQPWEIFLVTAVKDFRGITADIQVYPNPVSNRLIIKIPFLSGETYQFRISEITGKVLETGQLRSSETGIPFDGRLTGAYLLTISRHTGQVIQTYKIIKN